MKNTLFLGLLICSYFSMGQFHTVKVPQSSPHVVETQTLGITDITIDYHSPAARGRDVWPNVVGTFETNGIPWRAGANMNTRISFSTDVTINGEELKSGSYGFHVLIEDDSWTLLFAHHDNQWGSYYLDLEKDITLRVETEPTETNFSEQLDYEFVNRTDSSVVIALEWGDRRIPFTVGVDLNRTVVDNFRYELLGINTYQWEAWNDAASWCLSRNTNLEEALEWAKRSINGGSGGFAANKNITNMSTKIQLLSKLNKKEELTASIDEAATLSMQPFETYQFTFLLNQLGSHDKAINVLNSAIKENSEVWFLHLNLGVSQYMAGNTKKALGILDKLNAPDNFKPRLEQVKMNMKNGTYQLPN